MTRWTVLGVGLALALTGCTSGTTAPMVTVTVTATSPAPSTPSTAQSSAPPSTTTTTAAGFDTLPAGYRWMFVHEVKQVGGQWAAVVDPVTMCTPESVDPACAAAIKAGLDNDYAIVNVSKRTYTVALTGTAKIRLLASGAPTDFTTSAPSARIWSAAGARYLLAEVTADAQSRVSLIQEWWHP